MCVIIAAVALPGSGAGSRRGGRREPARVAHMERLGLGRGATFFFCCAINNLLELTGVGAGALCRASGPF